MFGLRTVTAAYIVIVMATFRASAWIKVIGRLPSLVPARTGPVRVQTRTFSSRDERRNVYAGGKFQRNRGIGKSGSQDSRSDNRRDRRQSADSYGRSRDRTVTFKSKFGTSRPSESAHVYGDYFYGDEKREPAYGYYDGDHLYGVTPVRLAIKSGRRQIKELLVQSGMDMSNKKDSKAAADIFRIAKQKGIEIREFSKHDLNMLTENRPHQGFVLRAEPLSFNRLVNLEVSPVFRMVLCLDEVWDPQNFGALLRTSYFLRCDKVVVCAKNSAPLSPTVSKASAGALEVMDVYSTDNLMKFLDKSRENGWQVVGTALGSNAVSLADVPRDKPTILVLGNEGHGIRTNVLRRCTHLVKAGAATVEDMGVGLDEGGFEELPDGALKTSGEINVNGAGVAATEGPSSVESIILDDAVDSLNVSVTGGIILHHFLAAQEASPTE
mmetsp:Transcript_18080/g.30363  ORF Transcript_18080/g.30363 Transcript_18080/m.30363 type:complete len:439 (-) Transcript_18080:168-1484(-)